MWFERPWRTCNITWLTQDGINKQCHSRVCELGMTFESKHKRFFPRKKKSQPNVNCYFQSWMWLDFEYNEITMCSEAMMQYSSFKWGQRETLWTWGIEHWTLKCPMFNSKLPPSYVDRGQVHVRSTGYKLRWSCTGMIHVLFWCSLTFDKESIPCHVIIHKTSVLRQ